MGFFDRLAPGQKADARPPKKGGHGSHWDTVTDSGDMIERCVYGALNNPQKKDRNPHDAMELTGWFRGSEVQSCVITGAINRAHQLLSAYPFIPGGTIHEVTVDGLEEWANGFEAQVSGSFRDARIAFFDTLYFRDRDQYPPGKPYRVALAGLAYTIRPAVLEPVRLADGTVHPFDPSFCGYMPFSRGDIDDFAFNAVIRDVSMTEYEGTKLCRLTIPLCKQDFPDGSRDIEIPVYASGRALNGYIPKAGDRVEGVFWLQGHQV